MPLLFNCLTDINLAWIAGIFPVIISIPRPKMIGSIVRKISSSNLFCNMKQYTDPLPNTAIFLYTLSRSLIFTVVGLTNVTVPRRTIVLGRPESTKVFLFRNRSATVLYVFRPTITAPAFEIDFWKKFQSSLLVQSGGLWCVSEMRPSILAATKAI